LGSIMIEQITKQFKSRDLEMDEANRGLEETRSASAVMFFCPQ